MTRRTRVALDRDPNQEVVDTYKTTDGSKQVTITAGPAQKASDLKDDPALRTTADTIQQTSSETDGKMAQGNSGSDSKNKADAKPDADVVRIDQVPADAQCRKVTTEMEVKAGGKKTERRESRQQDHQRLDPVPDGRRVETRLGLGSRTALLTRQRSGRC